MVCTLLLAALFPLGKPTPEVEPVASLLYTSTEIGEVRKAVNSSPLLQTVAIRFFARSRRWVEMSESDLQQWLPSSDAVFAMGLAGDPVTNRSWPRFGKTICSVERPFAVVSPDTGAVYGIQKPGERFYDDGRGWVRPEDGKRFFFKGIWNTFAVGEFDAGLDAMAVSYLLTGEVRYAERTLEILDRMATMRSRRPAADAPVDAPNPPAPHVDFFGYRGNNANLRMVAAAFAFDLVGKIPYAGGPSPTHPGLTVFENIRRNYFSVFERSSYIDSRASVANHGTVAYAAMTAEALLFGNARDLRLGIEGAYGLLDNTVDRDGEYYAAASVFEQINRRYAGLFLNLFRHYQPGRYPHAADFPRAEDYPYGLNFADDPAWYQTAVGALYRTAVLSRPPQYGDSLVDRFVPGGASGDPGRGTQGFVEQRAAFLKMIQRETTRPEWRSTAAALYSRLPRELKDNPASIEQQVLDQGPGGWLAPPPAEGGEVPPELQEKDSIVLGQKRIGILRSGDGENRRALFVHGGAASGGHDHNDQMAVTFYADGLCLTGAYDHTVAQTPDNFGYDMRFVANASAIVDEDSAAERRGSSPIRSRPPAWIEGYLPFAPVQVLEMSDPALWPQSRLTAYRRQTWMVDVSKTDAYFLDIVWIEGGKFHDYLYQAPFVDPPEAGEFMVTGVRTERMEGVWTLAGLDAAQRGAITNQPGKSWGERLEVDGLIRNLPGEKLPRRGWNPAPGNGYAFIWNLRGAETAGDWNATWLLHDHRHSFRMNLLNFDGELALNGNAPTRTPNRPAHLLIARRQANGKEPLSSRFVAVAQVSAGADWPVREACRLDGVGPHDVAVRLTLRDGAQDTFLAAGPHGSEVHAGPMRLRGRRAFIRKSASGELLNAVLSQGTLLECPEVSISLVADNWTGTVKSVLAHSIEIDAALPAGGTLCGQGIRFASPPDAAIPYSSNEFFTLEKVRPKPGGGTTLAFDWQSTVAARLVVEAKEPSGEIKTIWPNEMAAVMNRQGDPSRVFEGHLLREAGAEDGGTTLASYLADNRLKVLEPGALRIGEIAEIFALRPGDQFSIPSLASLQRTKGGAWKIRANMDVSVKLPGGIHRWVLRVRNGPAANLETDPDGYLRIAATKLPDGLGTLAPAPSGGEIKDGRR